MLFYDASVSLSASLPPVVVSRCDRIGDLILSLPVLGLLRDAGFERRILHCSPYASAVAEWAQFNGLCSKVIAGDAVADSNLETDLNGAVGLSLHHTEMTARLFRKAKLKSFGRRSSLSALWLHSKTFVQHRSRVETSEMQYNLKLARGFLDWLRISVPEFRGLPALQVPPVWGAAGVSKPGVVVAVSSLGSAKNWPLNRYLEWVRAQRAQSDRRITFLVAGSDAGERRKGLEDSGILCENGISIQGDFASLKELIAWLASAEGVLASSTGPLHIAHAAGVPVIGIYPTEPRVETFARWRPDGYWHSKGVRWIEIES